MFIGMHGIGTDDPPLARKKVVCTLGAPAGDMP